MKSDEKLSKAIAERRKVSADGSLVTYDLTEGIDFSHPKKIAESLSEVFFEKDAKNWFKVSGDHIDFQPAYKVRVVLSEEHSKLLEETVDDFLRDIKKNDLSGNFSTEIRDDARNATRIGSMLAAGSITSHLFSHSEEKVYAGSISDDLFMDVLESLEIRSLNNKDLMDWKKLPL